MSILSSYEDAVAMIDGVTRDIARFHLEKNNNRDTITEDDVDDWIYEVRISATVNQWKNLCVEYWNWYNGERKES